jgi:hypothetical protein
MCVCVCVCVSRGPGTCLPNYLLAETCGWVLGAGMGRAVDNGER